MPKLILENELAPGGTIPETTKVTLCKAIRTSPWWLEPEEYFDREWLPPAYVIIVQRGSMFPNWEFIPDESKEILWEGGPLESDIVNAGLDFASEEYPLYLSDTRLNTLNEGASYSKHYADAVERVAAAAAY